MNKNIYRSIAKLMLAGSFSVFCSQAFAQYKQDYQRSADKYYAEGDYYSAAQYYEKFLAAKEKKNNIGFDPYVLQNEARPENNKLTTTDEAKYRLAESYRMLNDHINAEKWYKNALSLPSTDYPHSRYYYAVSLRANGKYEEAAKEFEKFLKNYKRNDDIGNAAKQEVLNCRFIVEQLKRTNIRYETVKMGATFNKSNANYAPVLIDKQTMIFTSTRTNETALADKNKDPYLNGLYQATSTANEATKLSVPELPGIHQGVSAITPDGNKMFITRWSMVEGKKVAAIYVTEKNADKWSEPVILNTTINKEGYSSQQPFVTADGKYLFFSSDMPGGSGKFDIWYATLDANAKPEKVSNIGKLINTRDDDQAPYYHEATKTLVFASKGRTGMGGFDLYQSKGEIGNWSEPINPGVPVNSVKDDIYFASLGAKDVWADAFFSSDRNSNCCLEIYTLKKLKINKVITGIVIDCNTKLPLSLVSVNVKDGEGSKDIRTINTDIEGRYTFEIPDYQPMQVTANKEKYTEAKSSIATPADTEMDKMENATICLTPIPEDVPPRESQVMIVYFDFDKSDIRTDADTTLQGLVRLLVKEPTLVIELNGYTDAKGTDGYNVHLSEDRAKACYDYLIKAGIDASRLSIKSNGECCPVEQDTNTDGTDNPTGRQKNRRVEFKIIKY